MLLIAAVLLPTACLLWLINRAIGNERLLLRQELAASYRMQLTLFRDHLDADWTARSAALDATLPGPAVFVRIVRSGGADGAIVLNATGVPVYPSAPRLPRSDSTGDSPEWTQARQLEDSDPSAAASRYVTLGKTVADPDLAARAFQAAARCLAQTNHRREAAQLVMQHLASPHLAHAKDLQGRSISADALLMVLQFRDSDISLPAARKLRELLLDYSDSGMPSTQRLFLMREMRSLNLPAGLSDFPTLSAEELAEQTIEAESALAAKARTEALLRPARLPGVWTLPSASGRVIGLYRTKTVLALSHNSLSGQGQQHNVAIEIVPPGGASIPVGAQSIPAGSHMPGWQLVLAPVGEKPFGELASKQLALYVWIGSLTLVAVVALALVAARGISSRLRLAGLKTDLVAAVSHELKTPLASMRLLVDTLLDDSALDPQKTREYLELVARENMRLSQLIANFLAFSRMERNRYVFEFSPTKAEEIARAAEHAMGERFLQPGCAFEVNIEPNLPEIRADESALVTALVNLLDNAYKYTPPEKHIELRAFRQNGCVCFEVQDNGIGIASRDSKKIFRKFYQADSRLSRTGGGCGLGLAIVRFVVEAHGGNVSVSSELGKGSTFRVALRSNA